MSEYQNVPYIVWENDSARWERNSKRKTAVIIILMLLWAATSIVLSFVIFKINEGWKEFLTESDIETYTYDQGGAGVNIIGDENGVDYNGATPENKTNNQN